MLNTMIADGLMSEDFILFNRNFWYDSGICDYLAIDDCDSILSGSLKHGADMIVATINR